MRFRGTCYRAHDPRWAYSPLSGEGARLKGGRFNPVGTPALYLALTVEGAILEASHGFAHRFEPLTMCSYEVDIEDIIDLRTEANRETYNIGLADLGCPWALDRAQGLKPISWRIAEGLIATGTAGILVPSFAAGARPDLANLVLWKWGPDLPHRVSVYDPSGRLPKDQLSWR